MNLYTQEILLRVFSRVASLAKPSIAKNLKKESKLVLEKLRTSLTASRRAPGVHKTEPTRSKG